MFRKLLDEGQAGDNVGALLRGIDKDEVERGQVLAKPGSIKPHRTFKAEVYVLTKEEGGRHTPFFNGYRPQFYFRTTDVTGVCTLPRGVEMGFGPGNPGGEESEGGRSPPPSNRRVSEYGHDHPRSEDPRSPEGVRSPAPRPLGQGDRGDRETDGRPRVGAGAAADHHQPMDRAPLPPP